MEKKKFFNIAKNLLIFICLIFLFYEVYKNYSYIEIKVKNNKNFLFFVVLITILNFNLISLRNFSIYRLCAKYGGKFIDWGQIFFESLILNILVSHTGSVYRAIELKKRGLEYKNYIGLFYILFTSYILINIFLVFIELIFLNEVNLQFKINLLLIFLIILSLVLVSPKFLRSIIEFNFIKKNIHKYNLLEKFFDTYKLIFIYLKKKSSIKKTFYYLLGFGIIIHLVELYIFYISSIIILDNIGLKTLIILFGLSFILDRIPFISSIPGVKEILFASISIPLGLYFIEGLVLKLILRVAETIAIFFNFLIFYFLNIRNKLKT